MKRYFIALAVSLLGGLTSIQAKVSADSLRIILTGDILLDRGVRQIIEHAPSVEIAFNKLLDIRTDSLFHHAERVIGNLECPATSIKQPVFKRYMFRAEPEWLGQLARHGFTHINLANNHSIDQGRKGLTDTQVQIKKYGMTPLGAGLNMEEALQPVCIAEYPRKVWYISRLKMPLENFAFLTDRPCVAQESIDCMVQRIALLRKQNPEAYIIVSLHWGQEHTLTPTLNQRRQAHQIIDAGADILVGHHTHTLQTIENYHGHPIYYSIGNYIFDQQKNLNSKACMVKIVVKPQDAEVSTIPVNIMKCCPKML